MATLAQRQQQVGIIWSAMLSTVGIYGALSAFVVGTAHAGSDADAQWPRQALSAVALACGVLSVWWHRHFLAADRPTPAELAFPQMQGHGVVLWALSEAVGICGLLMAFIVDDAREFIPFGAAAAALLVLHRPSSLPWGRLAASAEGA